MAPRVLSRSLGRSPVGIAIVAWRVWQRLPPSARRRVLRAARTHGVRVASTHGPRIALLVAKRRATKRR